jgi:hypothetical protein
MSPAIPIFAKIVLGCNGHSRSATLGDQRRRPDPPRAVRRKSIPIRFAVWPRK